MRTFYFKSKVIGQERYLTYTMGEETELDEDVLDYCEENKPEELIDIIFEQDDDYDYLTYDISGRVSLADYVRQDMKCETVLNLLRNIASSLISLKEQTIHLNYLLLNRNFMYVSDELGIKFMCVPVESKSSLVTEFKGFVRDFLANLTYDVDENLDYVGKLLTYINGDNFNLRGLIGLSEALMEEEGLDFEEAGGIETDGVEVVTSAEPDVKNTESNLTSFMNSADDTDVPLPEIGDDEEEDEEEDEIPEIGNLQEAEIPYDSDNVSEPQAEPETIPVVDEPQAVSEVLPTVEEQTDNTSSADKEAPTKDKDRGDFSLGGAQPAKETDVDIIKSRLKAIVGGEKAPMEGKTIKSVEELDNMLNKPPSVKKNVVKVNRAALIQSAAAHEEENEEVAEIMPASADKTVPVEEIQEDMNVEKENKPKSNSILSKTVETTLNPFTVIKINPYLIRVNTEERIMINKPIFKLGKSARGVDYTVGGNGAISRQHAIIIQKDGVCYIRDNKSTNHTYVNDVMVEEGVDEILTHDSLIRLGDEEFRFKIR